MAKKKVSDFPLYLHRNNQWAKKVRQKRHYFGTDKEAALQRWLAEKDYLLADKVPPARNTGTPSVVELANLFAGRCRLAKCTAIRRRLHTDVETLYRVRGQGLLTREVDAAGLCRDQRATGRAG